MDAKAEYENAKKALEKAAMTLARLNNERRPTREEAGAINLRCT